MITLTKIPLPQGDIIVRIVDELPAGLREVAPEDGKLIVAHSETGHHHAVEARLAKLLRGDDSPWTCYLHVTAEYADLVNLRAQNPHETMRLPQGYVRIDRKTEYTPAGLRAVQD